MNGPVARAGCDRSGYGPDSLKIPPEVPYDADGPLCPPCHETALREYRAEWLNEHAGVDLPGSRL